MAASETYIPEQDVNEYMDYLYETDPCAGIAYEQMRLQVEARQMGRCLVGPYMRSIFGIERPSPEELYEKS